MARCLVTGSAGFMGSHLVDLLIAQGHEVLGLDNFSTGFTRNVNPHATTIDLDLAHNPQLVAQTIEGFKPDVVYSLAALAHEGLSAFCPVRITENTYNATLNTLIPAIRAGIKTFVFTSSMSVYGDQTPPFDETMERKPVDVYGVAKASSERAIEILSQVHGFDYTIVRPHNVYGPRQNMSDPYRNVAGIFMRRALTGLPLIVYGDGTQKRSFSYIDDVTPAIAAAGTRVFGTRFASKEIINIGPTEEYTINHLAEEVIRVTGSTAGIEHIADRPLEVKHAWCTNLKAQTLLGYETHTSFAEGIEKMYTWAKHLHDTDGIDKPKYLDQLELANDKTPTTWREKSL